MNKTLTIIRFSVVILLSIYGLSSCVTVKIQQTGVQDADPGLNSRFDSVSYAWGVNIAQFIEGYFYDTLDYNLMARGMHDYLSSRDTELISYAEARPLIAEYGEYVKQKRIEKNKQIGEEFLAQNAKNDSVIVLPSGVQYKILDPGQGRIPKEGDRVKCAYTGYLVDGRIFDSADVDKPYEYVVGIGQVIPGWEEIVKLMPVGSKWRVYIPANLAYGDNPRQGSLIEPGMTIIFDIELLYVQPVQ